MGSIVVDAVSHFHPPPHYPHSSSTENTFGPYTSSKWPIAATPSGRGRDVSTSRTSMSATGSRASSSQGTSQTPPTRHEQLQENGTEGRTDGSLASQPPPSPSLGPAAGKNDKVQPPTPSDGRKDAAESLPSGSSTAGSSISDGSIDSSSQRIKVRDLAHIQQLANDGLRSSSINGYSVGQKCEDQGPQYEISGMPVEHIIEMVAGLLTKITTTNDRQHEHLHRQMGPPESAMSPQTNSVLAFHGKNVPSITILSYLNRINKYCPTSYEVFIGLLVYFDRMTEKVNAGPMQNLRDLNQASERAASQHGDGGLRSPAEPNPMEGVTLTGSGTTQTATPPLSGSYEKQNQGAVPGTPHSRPHQPESPAASSVIDLDALNLSHFFVVDSFNIHRLIIAGVTCASKFFSDIFYTNSRYAKVGGLPLPELNHLELQFLLLNDFRLAVPIDEMEAYGTMLVEFYAREVLAQRQAEAAGDEQSQSTPQAAG